MIPTPTPAMADAVAEPVVEALPEMTPMQCDIENWVTYGRGYSPALRFTQADLLPADDTPMQRAIAANFSDERGYDGTVWVQLSEESTARMELMRLFYTADDSVISQLYDSKVREPAQMVSALKARGIETLCYNPEEQPAVHNLVNLLFARRNGEIRGGACGPLYAASGRPTPLVAVYAPKNSLLYDMVDRTLRGRQTMRK